MSRKKTTEQFIAEARVIHGDKYDYSVSVYEFAQKKLKIKCPIHGVWETKPNWHLACSSGCPECGVESQKDKQRKPEQEVLKIFKSMHGDKYLYDFGTSYKNKDSKISIKCPDHGWFKQSIHNHGQNKQGCPSCATGGYSLDSPGQLYILVSDRITKAGITNITAKRRSNQVSKSSGKKFSVRHEYFFSDGKTPSNIETLILRELRSKYTQPSEKFQGYSECFYDVDHTALLTRINELIQEHLDAQSQEVQLY